MPPQPDYNQTYEDAGAAWNVDPSLLRAMAAGESGGQGDAATSRKGAEGRMQFIPATARGIGITDTRDSEQSIWGAAKLMSQNLDASKGDVNEALRLYQGGPNRAGWGKENAAYPAYIMSKYKPGQTPAPANDAPAPAAPVRVAANGPSAFDAAFGGGSAPAPVAASASSPASPSAFDAAFGPSSAPSPAETPAKSGIVANVLTGLKTGAEGTLNVLSDPFGNLIGKPLGVGAVFAHDAIAPMFGGQRFTPEQRDMLLSDNVPQPGTRFGSAVASAVGGVPEVTQNTLGEKLARAGASGLAMGGVLGAGNRIAALAGAAGGVTGTAAEQAVPDYAAPMAGLAGNIVGGGLAARAGGMALPNRLTPAAESAPARVEPRLASAGPVPAESVTPGGPQPGMGAPGSMGAAATPAQMATMTAAETAAYKKKGDLERLMNPVKAGRDATEYVAGEKPFAAGVMGDADLAVQHTLAEQTTGNKQRFAAQAAENNDVRVEKYMDTAGDATITNSLADAKNAAFDKEVKGVLANAKPVDASPVVDRINAMLSGPESKESSVRKAVSDIQNSLHDANGKLETDPNMLYGVRKEINAKLSKEAATQDPTILHAKSALIEIKGLLDSAIEVGAPGFKQGIANFAEAMRPIEAQQLLQRELPNLFNANAPGVISSAKYSNFMKRVYNQQNEAGGANPYKSISDEQTSTLYDIHSSLQREARIKELAKTGGSPTSMLQRGVDAAATGAEGLAHAAALASPFPFVANMGIRAAKGYVADRVLAGKTNRLLDGLNYVPKGGLNAPP